MVGQSLSQNFIQSLRQEQIMAPQQIQALEILVATIPELEQKISSEMADNPTLELIENAGEHLVGNPVETHSEFENSMDNAAAAVEKDESLATLIQLSDVWNDYSGTGGAAGGGTSFNSDDEEKRQYLFDSLIEEKTLQDTLMDQLREEEIEDELTNTICEHIIGSIDDGGYMRTHISDVAIAAMCDLNAVKQALKLVQSFEPPGVAARDLRECLMLQLERKGEKKSLAYEVVSKHLEDIGKNHIPQVAKALRISPTQLYEVLEEIKRLNPYPGNISAPAKEEYVYPEVFFEQNEKGEWTIRSNKDYTPRLRISPYYLNLLKDPNTPAEVKEYLREKANNSKLLLRAISQRRSTIERIAETLIEYQRDFLDNGMAHLQPLTMTRVAEDVGVHETTVSRAIAGKYAQTPHGLIAFRKFFSGGYETGSGESVSSHGIKERIKKFIDEENPRKPLSDQKLAEMLKAEGFDVARRTVAKYREEEGIQTSRMRKSF